MSQILYCLVFYFIVMNYLSSWKKEWFIVFCALVDGALQTNDKRKLNLVCHLDSVLCWFYIFKYDLCTVKQKKGVTYIKFFSMLTDKIIKYKICSAHYTTLQSTSEIFTSPVALTTCFLKYRKKSFLELS